MRYASCPVTLSGKVSCALSEVRIQISQVCVFLRCGLNLQSRLAVNSKPSSCLSLPSWDSRGAPPRPVWSPSSSGTSGDGRWGTHLSNLARTSATMVRLSMALCTRPLCSKSANMFLLSSMARPRISFSTTCREGHQHGQDGARWTLPPGTRLISLPLCYLALSSPWWD